MEESIIFNLLIQRGASFTKSFVVEEGESPNYTLANLTGCTAKASAKSRFSNSETLFNFTVTINALAGEITLSLPTSITNSLTENVNRYQIPDEYQYLTINNLPGRPYVYDLILTDSLGYTYRIAEGGVLVTPRVTIG